MWCIILFINSFSKTFPATFIKLIGLNFDTYVEFSLPGSVVGIIFTFFHFFGKHPFLKHSLYSVYINVGSCVYTL
jgi:predicted membrane protein